MRGQHIKYAWLTYLSFSQRWSSFDPRAGKNEGTVNLRKRRKTEIVSYPCTWHFNVPPDVGPLGRCSHIIVKKWTTTHEALLITIWIGRGPERKSSAADDGWLEMTGKVKDRAEKLIKTWKCKEPAAATILSSSIEAWRKSAAPNSDPQANQSWEG